MEEYARDPWYYKYFQSTVGLNVHANKRQDFLFRSDYNISVKILVNQASRAKCLSGWGK